MKHILFIGTILLSTQAIAQTSPQPRNTPVQPQSLPGQTSSNPWEDLPTVVPYRNLAEAIKATSKPREASPLNPSCEGMTGDACVRSEEPKR